MAISENVKKQRKKAHLSQQDLADKLHISRQSISKWENGTQTPDIEKIKKLSEIYNISIDELVTGTSPIEHTSKNDESIILFIITGVCSLLPVIDLIAPFFIIKRNKKSNRFYNWINVLNIICFILALANSFAASLLADKFF